MKNGKENGKLKRVGKVVGVMLMALTLVLFGNHMVKVSAENAITYQMSVTTNRAEGTCSYQINGLDPTVTSSIQVNVSYKDGSGNMVNNLQQTIQLTQENCVGGVYNGTFSLDEMSKRLYESYTVSCVIGEDTVTANTYCDFSLHKSDVKMSVKGQKTDEKRQVALDFSDTATEAIVPGKDNSIAMYVWKKGTQESKAVLVDTAKTYDGKDMSWSMDVSKVCSGIGTYYAKATVENNNSSVSLAKVSFTIDSKVSSFKTKKTAALEKKKAFSVSLKGLTNPVQVRKVSFHVFNSAGKEVYSKNASDKNHDGSLYYAEITLKSLGYKLDKYTIKANITDIGGNSYFISKTTTVDERASAKSLTISKNKNARTSTFKVTNVYVPGKVKKVGFWVYYKKNGSFKLMQKIDASKIKGTKNYKASMSNKYAGSYKVCAYGYTNWGTEVLLKTATFKVAKNEAAKNGWFYEKYNGKTYKFYYVNGAKQTDLTKVLGLKYSSSSNVNNFYIEINRAACCVTVYAYDSVKKKYIIPVKTFTVSVGRDTSTVAGAGALNEDTSFTPIGTFSICSNGISVKYTVKQMLEPDGSICYARWASHIVGNVYFHAVAVGSDSHYALSATNYNRLGSPASAGCIRMTVADAKWIYDYASTGSTVKIVAGDSSHPGPLGKAKTITISSSISYDPTDPAVPLSRKQQDYAAGRISGYMTASGKKVGY